MPDAVACIYCLSSAHTRGCPADREYHAEDTDRYADDPPEQMDMSGATRGVER